MATDPDMPPLWEEAQRIKAEQQRREAEFLAAVAAAWLALQDRLRVLMENLLSILRSLQSGSSPPTAAQMRDLEITQAAIAQTLLIADEAVAQWVPLIEDRRQEVIGEAQEDGNVLLETAAGAALLAALLGASGITLPNSAIADVLAGLMANPQIRETILSRVGEFINRGLDVIIDGAGTGAAGNAIVKAALEELSKLADTAAIVAGDQTARAYREALLAVYSEAANKIPVIGYRRVSKRDRGVCPACIALDGKFYRLNEYFSEHVRGRCIAVPVLEGEDKAAWPTGVGWIAKQPPDVQKSILGQGRWEAWKRGDFDLDDLAKVVDGPFGPSLQSTPLKDLVPD